MNEQTATSIVHSIDQVINLIYNEPIPAVRAALAQALTHAFAAMCIAEKPRIGADGSGAPVQQHSNAPAEHNNELANSWDVGTGSVQHTPVTENRSAPTTQYPRVRHRKYNGFHTAPNPASFDKSQTNSKRANVHRKRLKSSKFRQDTAHKQQLHNAQHDIITWAQLGILEEKLTNKNATGTVVSQTTMCAEHLDNTTALQLHEVCSTHPTMGNSPTVSDSIGPEDSASNCVRRDPEMFTHLSFEAPNSEGDTTSLGETGQDSDCETVVHNDSASTSLFSSITGLFKNKHATHFDKATSEAIYRGTYLCLYHGTAVIQQSEHTCVVSQDVFERELTHRLCSSLHVKKHDIPTRYVQEVFDQYTTEVQEGLEIHHPDWST